MEVWGGNGAFRNAISVPGIDAWISSRPYEGDARGGDLHYVSTCGAGRISRFAIADVAGHGAPAGKLAERLRSLMRKHINTLDQTRFAQALNREFSHSAQPGRFATALLATYFTPTDQLLICNAGHPLPLWYHAGSRRWELLDHDVPERASTVVNLPLGLIGPSAYSQFAVRLDKGDLVLIYTDSLIESRSPRGEPLGQTGLLDLVRRLEVDRPQELNRRVLAAVADHHGTAAAADDETLLVLHHNAADPPPPTIGQTIHAMAGMLGLVRS